MGGTKNFFKEKKEWSIVKDNILNWYLTPYLSKIINTRKPVYIIDCFAGKGKFDSGEVGSPLIIAEQINSNLNKKSSTDIKLLCIEKNKNYYNALEQNLMPFKKFCYGFNGTFEDGFDSILKSINNKNVFFYIDPYGIKSLNFDIFNKIKKSNCHSYEVLMNFNTFGFLREGCRILNYKYDSKFESEVDSMYELNNSIEECYLSDIANGTYWKDILYQYNNKKITMLEAEELFIDNYLKTLERKNIFKYTLSIQIKLKQKNMLKYRLVFGTNHIDGLFLMCDNMNQKLNYMIEKENLGQMSLFSNQCGNECLDINNKARNKIIDILKQNKPNFIDLEELYYKLIKVFEINYKISNYKKILTELEKDNLILVERDPEHTKSGRKSRSFDIKKHKIKIASVY
ncbi:hypothetical protein CLPU_6c00100 [Gottschalkia purinilytica]|uniref:Three-Cys-motif partner protein TcmP n=1 Tax=Gottschalkia purinilytica TaxID=1503 RepID=A0A0L0WAI6_GOTPU|nr:three-Cys-motif partner protein TcmP [Gottschalkia purinilytica]KNF08524.1 hypothetical protein CLPU_6c00100 [Gottschalkia purinilytica]